MLRRIGMLAVLVFMFVIMTGSLVSNTHAVVGDENAITSAAMDEDTTTNDEGKPEKTKARKKRDYARTLHSKIKRPGAPQAKPKYKPWNKVITKDHKKSEGFLTIYTKQEEAILALSEDQLDVPMLATMSLSQGIGSHFLYGGLPVDNMMFDFHRNEDHIQVRRLSTDFRAPGNEGLEKAMDLTFSTSIVAALKIASEEGDKIAISINDLYLSDEAGMSFWLGAVFRQPVRLSRDKNYFESIKNYPENTEIDTRLTYLPSRPQALNLPNVSDPRYITVGVQYSIRKLPETPMTPRIADDRVGYFTTDHKDFTRVGEDDFFVHYANRWRLEKKDPSAALSEPVKPIVYYMDRTIPEEYVQYIMDGVEFWQRAFEKAGFKNAIIAKRAPTPEEDPEYDAEDVRYNTIRWNTSDQVMYGAIGPSQVDPRTGEIISADILFEHAMVANFGKAYRRYSGPKAALMAVDPNLKQFWMSDEELAEEVNIDDIPQLRGKGHMFCAITDQLLLSGHFQSIAMMANGTLDAGQPLPKEYVGDALRFVAAHEVGHTLGLRHNFKSSGATPYDKLNDKAAIEQMGMTGSVMDYPTANVARDRSKQGYYYTPNVGTYDEWAIEWGYKPVDGDDEWQQSKNLEELARRCTEKANLYGTDEDTYPLGALDPRSNINDLSDDPMAWASERMGICNDLLQGGGLEERVVKEGGSYYPLRLATQTVIIQKYIAGNVAIKNIGGSYTTRSRKGSSLPLQPVDPKKQRDALDFIINNSLNTSTYLLDPSMLSKMQDDKMWSWENNPFAPGRRFDFPLSQWVAMLQRASLTNLMNPLLQGRVVENSMATDNPFKLSQLYTGLTRAIWTNNPTPRGRTAVMDHNLQRIYTDLLIDQVTVPGNSLPQEAISLSRLNLRRIKATAEQSLSRTGLDDETNAHLMETIARIDRALEADRITNF